MQPRQMKPTLKLSIRRSCHLHLFLRCARYAAPFNVLLWRTCSSKANYIKALWQRTIALLQMEFRFDQRVIKVSKKREARPTVNSLFSMEKSSQSVSVMERRRKNQKKYQNYLNRVSLLDIFCNLRNVMNISGSQSLVTRQNFHNNEIRWMCWDEKHFVKLFVT